MLIISFISTVLSMLYFLAVCKSHSQPNASTVELSLNRNSFLGYFYNFFDVRMIWFTHLFDTVGGGIAIAYIMLYSLLTEAIDPHLRSVILSLVLQF